MSRGGSASSTARRGEPPAPERGGAPEASLPEAVLDGDVLWCIHLTRVSADGAGVPCPPLSQRTATAFGEEAIPSQLHGEGKGRGRSPWVTLQRGGEPQEAAGIVGNRHRPEVTGVQDREPGKLPKGGEGERRVAKALRSHTPVSGAAVAP